MKSLNFEYIDPFICFIDPISLTGLALAGAGSFFGSKMASSATATPPPPTQPPSTPQPVEQPVQQPQYKAPPPNRQPTFLGAAGAAPPVQSGQKTLLGQ